MRASHGSATDSGCPPPARLSPAGSLANDERVGAVNDRDGRPHPDALLRQAEQDGRGRLKIFLGAAPGVGKTYEMLLTAQAKQRQGVDVVVASSRRMGARRRSRCWRDWR